MRLVPNLVHSLRTLNRRKSLWAVLLAVASLTGSAFAQGPIDVNETGLHDGQFVYGIDGTLFSSPWTNNQIIHVLGWGETEAGLYTNVMFSLYGIYSGTNMTNLAAIDVNGIGGNAYSDEGTAYANVNVYGIYGDPYGNVEVTNSGNITVTARGGNAEGDGGTSGAYSAVYGISANHTLTNSGVIDASAFGGTATASNGYTYASAFGEAYGLRTNGDIVNEGQVTASATGGTATSTGMAPNAQAFAQAFGLYAYSGVANTGNLTALATGGTADGNANNTSAAALAYAIQNSTGDVTNSGDIVATAAGGSVLSGGTAPATAIGIHAGDGNINNSGDITVTATAQDDAASEAYGIYLSSEVSSGLTNTGTIRAFGDDAYELYVANGTAVIAGTYNVTLDGNPSTPSIFVGNGATLNLNNALLTVTDVVGSDPGATQWNTEYRLFGVASEGAVTGSFSSVAAINPDVTAYYYTQGTGNAADDTVALGYEPQHSETLASATVQRRMVGMAPYAINQHMTSDLMYDMLALDELDEPAEDDAAGDTAQGLTACQRSGGAFLQPHYSYIKRDDDPLGYNAGLTGVSGGYSQCVNSSLLGLHVGYGKANIDYTGAGYSANTEDQGVVTSGFSGMTRWRPWLLRYGFSGFRGWHDYRGLTGLGLTESESASYDSYGGTGLVMVGRTFKHKKHVFLPEVGANWLWIHRESYTTEATDPAWDTTYSTLNEHDVWAQAALHWQSLYRYKKLQFTPSASVGIHQLLTDGESKVYQSVPGAARVMVEDEMDETAVALATSVVIRSRRTAVTLAYDGEYSSDIEQHNFWVKCRLRF